MRTALIFLVASAPAVAGATVRPVSSDGSLVAAIARAEPGDVIEVRGGTYPVNLSITRDGTAAAPIVLRAAAGETVVLSARKATLRTIEFVGASHWRLQGLHLRGSRHAIVRIDGGTDVVIDACEIYDGTKKGIIANGDLITIKNSVIRDIKQPMSGDDTQGIASWRSSRLRIHDNLIATPGDGILIGGAGELTRTPTDVRIYRNHFHTQADWYGRYKVENAIDVKAGEAVVITDNVMHRYRDLDGMDGGVAMLVHTCDPGAPDLHIDGVRIERNEIYDVGRALSIQGIDGPGRGVKFRRNLVYAALAANQDARHFPAGVVAGNWDGVDVDNNTFIDVDHAAVHTWGTVSAFHFRNNVLRRTGGVVLEAPGNAADYSCRSATPATGGAHDIVANQRFVDDDARDYRLAAGSPCIDHGVNVGLSYVGTRPDIGRWEYGSSVAHTGGGDEGSRPAVAPLDGRPVDWARDGTGDTEGRHADLRPP